jgi:hypothetical protein
MGQMGQNRHLRGCRNPDLAALINVASVTARMIPKIACGCFLALFKVRWQG